MYKQAKNKYKTQVFTNLLGKRRRQLIYSCFVPKKAWKIILKFDYIILRTQQAEFVQLGAPSSVVGMCL
jgi:hypothetical protein